MAQVNIKQLGKKTNATTLERVLVCVPVGSQLCSSVSGKDNFMDVPSMFFKICIQVQMFANIMLKEPNLQIAEESCEYAQAVVNDEKERF